MNPFRFHRAFTLVELVVTVGIVGILSTLVVTGVRGSLEQGKKVKCTHQLREIGRAVLLYGADNQNEFPRSAHNAWALGREPWGKALIPYLAETAPEEADETWFFQHFRCPSDTRTDAVVRSYGLNVFYQLGPGDLYKGSPTTWRTLAAVPRPGSTVLIAENRGSADHFMCHQWTTSKGASNEIDSLRHQKKANYLFADGHVETLDLAATFDTKTSVNRWNPSLAK